MIIPIKDSDDQYTLAVNQTILVIVKQTAEGVIVHIEDGSGQLMAECDATFEDASDSTYRVNCCAGAVTGTCHCESCEPQD
jgi:hypothetical protein